jgi:hypothetical protein
VATTTMAERTSSRPESAFRFSLATPGDTT